MKKILFSIGSLFFFFQTATQAYAVNAPTFASCLHPEGEIIATYNSGIHGIVGETQTYTGSDTVYKMNDSQVVQCFCPENEGQGIETSWWKYDDISETDRVILQRQGWIHVVSGKNWGLDDASYLAKNSRYDCRSTGIGGGVLGINSFATTGNQTFWLIGGVSGLLLISFLYALRTKK